MGKDFATYVCFCLFAQQKMLAFQATAHNRQLHGATFSIDIIGMHQQA